MVDSQASPAPALEVLASPAIDVVTLTVTEKGYCHIPSSGELDLDHPDIVHDLADPEAPRSLPGLIARALELRMRSHGRPVTLMSCDNIPANGVVLANVVNAIAIRRGRGLSEWIADNAAFPSSMVDRIAPATSPADIDMVEQSFGYRDHAVVVGEPFRQWVIEQKFAGRAPQWDLAGASFVDDVTPFEHLKMRMLNGAQSSLAYLGVLAGLEHTFDDIADPLLQAFIRRMLIEESLPTLRPVPGVDAGRYVEQSLDRLRNTAIRHRNHQIATDGSQKIVQRLLNPIARKAAARPGHRTAVGAGRGVDGLSDPVVGQVRQELDRVRSLCRADRGDRRHGSATTRRRWPREILAIDTIFDRALAANADIPAGDRGRARRLAVGPSRWHIVRRICDSPAARGRSARRDRQAGPNDGEEDMKLGVLTAPFPDTPLAQVADWAARVRLRGAGDRLLAEIGRPEPPLCRHQPYRRRQPLGVAGQGDRGRAGARRSWRSRRSATIPIRCIPILRIARPSSTI